MANFDPKREFEKDYDQYLTSIYRFVYIKTSNQHIAEEITADVFTKYWAAIQNKPADNARAFLYRIARNSVTDYYRKKGRYAFVSTDDAPEPIEETANLEDKADLSLDMGQIQIALSHLKDDYQNVVIWHYLDELTIPEIAKTLQRSEGAVRTLLSRALAEVREQVQKP